MLILIGQQSNHTVSHRINKYQRYQTQRSAGHLTHTQH